MTDPIIDHPIKPSGSQLDRWELTAKSSSDLARRVGSFDVVHRKALCLAYADGADQELEACCEWLRSKFWIEFAPVDELRAFRRPKPSSLKKQALLALNVIEDKMLGPTNEEKLIRRAIESIPD